MRPFAAFSRVGGPWLPTLAVFALAMGAQFSRLGDPLDRRLHDAALKRPPARPAAPSTALPDAAVVTLDPRSLRALDDWPWPRRLYATAIERLDAVGAVAIAFDIDFSAPTNEADDSRFASALRASGRVALATFSQTETMEGGLALEIVNRPIESLSSAAHALGNVLVPIEPDGVVRQVPPVQSIGGTAIPSLARAALAIATGDERSTAAGGSDGPAPSSDPSRSQLVDYRRSHPSIPTVAFVDLIEGRFDPALLAGRTVFIGATAAEFQDLWATPVDPALPGVMIQAIAYRTAVAERLGASTLRPAPLAGVAAALLILSALLHPRRRLTLAARALIFAGAGAAVIGLGWLSLWQVGVVWPVTVPLAVVAAQYALGIEGLERHVRRIADAHASSLDALARVSDLTTDLTCPADPGGRPEAGLELALRLLGDVVGARGVVLLRVVANQVDFASRLEWRPQDGAQTKLRVDPDATLSVIAERRAGERPDLDRPDARVVYSPLAAGSEIVGILVVFCRVGQALDSLQRRTLATVGAQLALTAQNLQLIERLRETFESSIAAVASAVEARDGYTDQHCRRLAAFSSLMGARLGMPADEIRAMELGALLHDVGKIGIRDAILNKPDRLLPAERREMQRHPEIGAGIVAQVVGLEPTTLHCILHHHECWDGSGYPKGLCGRDIPLAARIVSIVDVWDALSTSRPYKKAFRQDEVRELIRKGAGNQFDPELVELFFQILDEQGEDMLALIARSSDPELAP